MKRILISTSSFGKDVDAPLLLLREKGFDITLNPYGRQLTVDEAKSLLPGIDGLIAGTEKLNAVSLSAAADLKYIIRLGAGMDNVDTSVTGEKGIRVENTPDAHIDSVAELALGGILAQLRSMPLNDRQIRQGTWAKPMGTVLRGKTIGLIGLGRVAKRLVALLAPFQCRIIASDPFLDTAFAEANNIAGVALDTLLHEADIISLHAPFTPEDRYLLDDAAFGVMKQNVLLVNTSRGGLVDEAALFGFLQNNAGARAYIDTFEQEPYEGRLRELDNVLLTGHIGTYAREVRAIMEMEAATKLIQFFESHE